MKWTVALISLMNMAVGLPMFLNIISPKHFMPRVLSECGSDLVERLFGVALGLAAIQLGLLRWLMVRSFGRRKVRFCDMRVNSDAFLTPCPIRLASLFAGLAVARCQLFSGGGLVGRNARKRGYDGLY